jgi:hypothetical protein
MRSHPIRRLGPVLLVALGFAGVVWASHEGPATVLVPYQGHLEDDGVPLEGTASLTFAVYSAVQGGTLLHTETEDVLISAGNFAHVIGEAGGLDSDEAAGELWLAIEVEGTPLGGRQRVTPAPQAVTASRAHNLTLTSSRTTWGGWNEALHLDNGGNAAITHGNLLFGLHDTNDTFYWANITEGYYQMSLETNPARLRTPTISVNGGSDIVKLAHGRAGNCSSGQLADNTSVNFGTTFASPPRVFLQPVELDNAGCVGARVVGLGTTSFTVQSFAYDGVYGCGCIDWLAIGY